MLGGVAGAMMASDKVSRTSSQPSLAFVGREIPASALNLLPAGPAKGCKEAVLDRGSIYQAGLVRNRAGGKPWDLKPEERSAPVEAPDETQPCGLARQRSVQIEDCRPGHALLVHPGRDLPRGGEGLSEADAVKDKADEGPCRDQ